MIPSRPPPRLTEPSKWSKELNDFVAKCLTKVPPSLSPPFLLLTALTLTTTGA